MGLDAGQSPPFRAHPAPGQGVSLQPGRTGAVTTPVLPSWPGDSTPLTLPTCLQHQIPAVEPHGAGRGRKVTSWQLTLLLTRVWGLRGQGSLPAVPVALGWHWAGEGGRSPGAPSPARGEASDDVSEGVSPACRRMLGPQAHRVEGRPVSTPPALSKVTQF